MITAKVSEYRSHLSSFHKKVISDHDPLLISGHYGNVVIIPEDDYENLIETIYILRDKTTIKSLESVRKEIASDSFKGHDLKNIFKDVLEN
ncbi:unnamed protein product [marine sediment metagenome]|uniref:Antitoxin n=1 Tax=marine sediment metagenome TaxID=412755 RepID=X1E1B7_9ZZZZ